MRPDALLITHARVFTADVANPRAEAVLVRGNRIVYVGSDEEARRLADSHTRVIDAQQATLMPGIIDSHYHLFMGSTELGHIQLWDVHSMAELAAVIRQYAQEHPEAESLSCVQLRYEIMPPDEPLTRHHLDAIVRDRPLTIMGYDHHNAWANTRALELSGTLRGAVTGPNSSIVMGEDGTATGWLVEPAAYCMVLRHFEEWARTVKALMGNNAGEPRIHPERERHWLREGLKLTARQGITSVHNMDGDLEQAEFYAAMDAAGELTARVSIPYSVFPSTKLEDLEQAVQMAERFRGEKVHAGRVKIFMDGVLEAWTALMLDDYADRPGWKGDALYRAEHFNWLAEACDRMNLQITVHAIGDAAVRRTLDGYERAQRINGCRDSRHRIEHIEVIHPDDLPRFARLGVLASVQPLHSPIAFPETYEVSPVRIGRERWHRSYAWQNLRGAGARVAFGSDWPVVTQDVMAGIHAALNRRSWGDGYPDHRQSLSDTLLSYTREGAYFEFQEHVKGQLRAGMLADMVLMSGDLFSAPEQDIQQIRPVLTVCDVQITFEG
jgi:predicted amidohydrolase YtcJ